MPQETLKKPAILALCDRATRLARLVNLCAPDDIIETEVRLIVEARDRWRTENGHDWQKFERQHRVQASITDAEIDDLIRQHVGDVDTMDIEAQVAAVMTLPDGVLTELYDRHERELVAAEQQKSTEAAGSAGAAKA